jgi:hypothetical protein
MSAHHEHYQPTGNHPSPFEAHARQALQAAIVYYGWDHPVVASAQRSLTAIRETGGL